MRPSTSKYIIATVLTLLTIEAIRQLGVQEVWRPSLICHGLNLAVFAFRRNQEEQV